MVIPQPRWMRVVAARWWYALVPVQALLAWQHGRWSRGLFLVDVLVLGIGIGLFVSAAYRQPHSPLARAWSLMALSWSILLLRQLTWLLKPANVYLDWLDVLLVLNYGPGIVLAALVFYDLPFQRRSRVSLLIDCAALVLALTLVAREVLHIAVRDSIFITGNLGVLLALSNIYQQARDGWRVQFRAVAGGLTAMVISDSVWLALKASGHTTVYSAPLYTWAWLIFARATLAAPGARIRYDEQAVLYVPPLQDALGVLMLGISAVCLLWVGAHVQASALIVVLISTRIFETLEYQRLQRRLDHSRQQEGQLRGFIQATGHDLKTPINAIAAYAPLLEPSPAAAQIAHHAAEAQQRVRLLLDIAKTMQQQIELERVTLAEIAAELHALWEPLHRIYPLSHITLHVEHAANTALRTDRQLLLRTLENLLVNAARALRDQAHGQIICRLCATSASISISVADDGPGYPAPVLEQRSTHASDRDSSGLGLAGVRTLVHALGGTLELRNPASGGALATVRLPLDTQLRAESVDHRIGSGGV